MSDEETIAVADISPGPGGTEETTPGETVELPAVEALTGRGFITGKSGGGKSIVEGTPVHTADGRKPIETVTEGDRVLSLNKRTYEQEFREVQATIEHTDDRLLRVTLEDGTELVGTEDHSFLTADGLEIVPVRGDELEEGTWLPLSRELPSAESVEAFDLAEYLDGESDVVVDGGVIRSGPRKEDRTLSLDFPTGKEVGLYLAEGSFDSHLTVQLSNVDDGVREFLGDRGYNLYEGTCNKGFRPYARFLVTEFGRGSSGKQIPEWAFDAAEPFRAGLLSGYFDGGGAVNDETVTAMSESPELIDGLSELLRQFAVSTTVRDKFSVYDGDRRRYRRLRVDPFCVGRFAEVVELSVADKRERLSEVVADVEDGYNSKDVIPNFGPVLNVAAQAAGRSTCNRLVSELGIGGHAAKFGRSDIQWKRVVEIEPLSEERTVYDLDVAVNDNFVANGVFVHNSNTASVVVERLLDNNFPVMIVDADGEYYGLKEEYEVLHAGADEECDIQVSPEHAEKLATLALEENVPIILDVSGYLDESEASELILAVARQLFAKEKKLKKPFLLLVEECHEYVPEGAGLDETGKMLIKIGKRGRKHGLGIVGISQRPADVKKDFITQCDWLVWHRLTWDNDTKVVGRVLGSAYADAVEDLDDGEAFLMADWEEAVRRVKFHRKETFDAGATPGLEDFERPELKSVGGDLVSELESITDERVRRESELADLRQELDKKRQRIQELERELEEARDMSEMADRFAQALLQKAEAPYRSGPPADGARTPDPVPDASEEYADIPEAEAADATEAEAADAPDSGSGAASGDADGPEPVRTIGGDGASPEADGDGEADGGVDSDDEADSDDGAADPPGDGAEPSSSPSSTEADGESASGDRANRDGDVAVDDDAVRAETASAASLAGPGGGSDEPPADATPEPTVPFDAAELADREAVVAGFVRAIDALEPITRAMLAHYRSAGIAAPIDAHVAAGGSGERSCAYARNRRLRLAGLIEHVARGRYRYALPALVGDVYAGASQQAVADAVAAIEAAAGIADSGDDPTVPEER